MLRLTVSLAAGDSVSATLTVLFLRFRLYPKAQKRPDPRRFTRRRFMRRMKKEREKRMKNRRRAGKKATAQAVKKQKKAEAPDKSLSLGEKIELLTKLSKSIFSRLSRYLRLDVCRFRVSVASGDAAKTAVLYGVVSQLAVYLFEFLDSFVNLKYPPERECDIRADFTGEKTECDITVKASLRLWQILAILVGAAYNYLAGKAASRARKSAKAKPMPKNEKQSNDKKI